MNQGVDAKASSRPRLVCGAVAWVAVAALVLAARTAGTGVVPADVGEVAGGGALDVAFHVRPAVDGGRGVLERAVAARRGQPGRKYRCRAAAVRGASLRAAAVPAAGPGRRRRSRGPGRGAVLAPGRRSTPGGGCLAPGRTPGPGPGRTRSRTRTCSWSRTWTRTRTCSWPQTWTRTCSWSRISTRRRTRTRTCP